MTFHIETERLVLREIRDEDIDGIYKLYTDHKVHEYLCEEPIKTHQEAKSIIEYIQSQYTNYGIGRWAVIDKETNEFIGWSGLKFETEVRDDMDYYDLGYRFISDYWGKGYATETGKHSLEYAFSDRGLDKLYAGAHVDNYGSNNVLRKLGFKLEEVFDYEGIPHNWYELTKDDWSMERK